MKRAQNVYLKALSRVWKRPVNPLPEILDLIPYGDTVVDLEFCDKIMNLLNRENPKVTVDNSTVNVLLLTLRDAGLVQTAELKFPSAHGKVLFIKRIVNG